MTKLIYDIRAAIASPVFWLARLIRGTPFELEERAMVLAETWTDEEWDALTDQDRESYLTMARKDMERR